MISLTTDILVFAQSTRSIALVQRKYHPCKGLWALPGGYFDSLYDKNTLECAKRELREETGLDVTGYEFSFLGEYSKVGRKDNQCHCVNLVYYCEIENEQVLKAQDDAKAVQWFSLDDLPELAFDHAIIIEDFFLSLIAECF